MTKICILLLFTSIYMKQRSQNIDIDKIYTNITQSTLWTYNTEQNEMYVQAEVYIILYVVY